MKKVLASLIFIPIFSACVGSGSYSQKNFGIDANYFLALKSNERGDQSEAERLFKISRKKGSPLVARRSAEALTLIGDIASRIDSALYLAENYEDEASLSLSLRELFSHSEYSTVIKLTDSVSLESSKNEIIKYRLKSLAEKNDSRFENEFFTWFISRPLSSEHIEVYKSYTAWLLEKNLNIQAESEKFQKNLNKRSLLESQLEPDSEEKKLEIMPEGGFESLVEELQEAENPEKKIIDFRIATYKRNYKLTFKQVDDIIEVFKNRGEILPPQILSDIGKANLYGSNDYFASARKFDRIAEGFSGEYPEQAYYSNFYAARLYDKAGRYPSQTVSRFKKALLATSDEIKFDNCLWYMLNFQLRTSTEDIITSLCEYGPHIHDAEYFDDFFESLSILLLSSHKWQDFYKVWSQTNSNFSEYTAGKYAYISGRLIEEGLVSGGEGTRKAIEAFTQVLNGKSSLYYKVCALERLNVTDKNLVDTYLLKRNDEIENVEDNGAKTLLKGYAAFGFPERIYSEWLSNRKGLSVEDSIEISKFLNSCAQSSKESVYNVQSLRIASRCFESASGSVSRELLELNFPQFYKQIISSASSEFEVPDYLMYALVRSESFFDATVTSKAGANGLTQLMESTADDEAKKLKISKNGEYDIFDPKTNVRLGTHYLSSLIGRTDGNNKLLALYAYNAGLTNVRNWAKRFRNDWMTTGKAVREPVGISMDLFLESLPFAETREYGRKVIAAAAMYAYLYDDKLPGETVREIMY